MKKKLIKNGFTLIEVIVSISIFIVLMLAINFLFVSLYRQQGTNIGMIQRINKANTTIDTMGREIREANRAESGYFTLATAGSSTLIFFSDIDEDGLTEKVSYFLDGTDLKKNVVEPGTDSKYADAGTTSVACMDVQNGSNPIFTYYDQNYIISGEPLTAPIDVLKVRLVGVSLDINSPSKKSSYPLHIETKVQFRNLR